MSEILSEDAEKQQDSAVEAEETLTVPTSIEVIPTVELTALSSDEPNLVVSEVSNDEVPIENPDIKVDNVEDPVDAANIGSDAVEIVDPVVFTFKTVDDYVEEVADNFEKTVTLESNNLQQIQSTPSHLYAGNFFSINFLMIDFIRLFLDVLDSQFLINYFYKQSIHHTSFLLRNIVFRS